MNCRTGTLLAIHHAEGNTKEERKGKREERKRKNLTTEGNSEVHGGHGGHGGRGRPRRRLWRALLAIHHAEAQRTQREEK